MKGQNRSVSLYGELISRVTVLTHRLTSHSC